MTKPVQYDPFNQVCCADCRWWVHLGPPDDGMNLCTEPSNQRIEIRDPATGKTAYVERGGFEKYKFLLPSPACQDVNSRGNCNKFQEPTPESDAEPDPPVVAIFRRIITGGRS
ncbi:hypothetical protein [Blastopirellula retiformator]|uniref:Uncharacterized protein n=1 Tax=Blastopirellula retiformator TaxID=2527970 RepID=A0A5C5UZ16_9BACT|nr:hypothetical protein [Blastopirellula retiformator]TWT30727.1 hypothetical protein Enr8_42500 [Blastopirellula retiformator]